MIRRGIINNRIISIGILCLLVFGGFVSFITFESDVVSAVTIYVGSGPGNDTTSIQDAIDNYANEGDTVFVYSGTYTENVDVFKTINLFGEDRDTTIIDGGVGFSDVVDVGANWVNITSFTIINGSNGIHISYSNNISIIDNIFSDTRYGINLEYSPNTILIDNTLLEVGISIQGEDPNVWNTHSIDTSNTVNGKPVFYWKNQNGGTIPPGAGQVILANCTNVKIENQNISNGSVGIQLGFSNNNYIAKNIAFLNNRYGIHLYFSEHNTLTDNTAYLNNALGILIYHSHNNTVIHNNVSNNNIFPFITNGILLEFSDYNTIAYNDVSSNGLEGIGLGSSSIGNTINNNNVSNTERGINLHSQCSNNRIINNNVSGNRYGIRIYSSNHNNDIIYNDVSNNMYGIYFAGSYNNNIYHNNLINNTNQGYDDTNNGNQWDNGYSLPFNPATDGGNYWSDFDEPIEGAYDDYNGPDQDIIGSDAIVDNGTGGGSGQNPYVIDSDSQDNYPLLYLIDTSPPIITNLQPPDGSTTNDNTPTIGADYSDPSGINMLSVLLKVDGIDVTSSAVVTASDVTYIPATALSDGVHTVYLEVMDTYNNLAMAFWTFTVDTVPPIITNLQPPDSSITDDSTPMIGANYNDLSGINASSVVLKVDGIDLTLSATVTTSDVSYLPIAALSDGIHTVFLEVKDIYGNLASAMWNFTVDTLSPMITNLTPPDASTTNDNTTTISADYNDLSGIDVSSVALIVDGIDVTAFATITASGVSYLPSAVLSDSTHTVYLEVKDTVDNLASVTWSFTVDSTPPIITNLQPHDGEMINLDIPLISADYSDLSGINVSSVLLKVDGIDVTSFVTVTGSGVSYTPGIPFSDSIHTVYLEVRDIYGNLATASWSFTVDTSPPITTISPNTSIVKVGTIFTLTATDGVPGSGVNYTQYKIDDGSWIDYVVPFIIDSYGYHNITYRSVDNLGNIENDKTFSIHVPEVPITSISIGSPQYGTTPRYVNQFTQFSFSVIDYSGLGYDTYYYIDSAPRILYYGPFTVLAEGAHTISYYSIDNLDNIEDTKQIEIIVDNTPPTTTIAIGDPNYVLGDTWVTSSSEFTLSTADGGLLPVGIDHTQYRIWNGVWSEWSIYQNVFTPGVNDGIIYVEFYSVDLLGNTESINNRTFIVDNTPPTTTILFEGPSYRDIPEDILNVTSETTFVFSVYNSGLHPVRFDFTEYRIWNNGTWSDWFVFSGEFNLGYENGTRYIEWYGIDKLGNKELTHNLTVFVDNIPPTTEYILQLESDNSETRISLISNDIGSGSAFTKYKINNPTWNIYSNTLVINEPGSHTVYFLSKDNLENIEEERELTVLIEEPEPTSPPIDDEEDTNNKPLIAFLFAIILLIVGTFVSMKRPLKKVKENKLSTWLLVVLPFVITEALTGVISFFTGILSVPPLFGIGMVVDSTILIAGLIVFVLIYRKQK
jgi:parallel beta-helix repeat protein